MSFCGNCTLCQARATGVEPKNEVAIQLARIEEREIRDREMLREALARIGYRRDMETEHSSSRDRWLIAAVVALLEEREALYAALAASNDVASELRCRGEISSHPDGCDCDLCALEAAYGVALREVG